MPQKVAGSRGDVKVKALYKNGAWELVFTRSIKAVNADDLSMNGQMNVFFSKTRKANY